MPEYADIYVISHKRDLDTLEGFLNRFVPQREESADDYYLPQYADDPDAVFEHASELIEYCAKNKTVRYAIYWRALDDRKPEHCMVFFLEDGNLIYGLSTDAADQSSAEKLLGELKDYLDTDAGYIGHEASPEADNLTEFLAQVEIHSRNRRRG